MQITREQRGSFFDPFITVKKKRRGREEEEMRERQGRENHKNDTVESKENTEARATAPPAQHAFIAIIFVISR